MKLNRHSRTFSNTPENSHLKFTHSEPPPSEQAAEVPPLRLIRFLLYATRINTARQSAHLAPTFSPPSRKINLRT